MRTQTFHAENGTIIDGAGRDFEYTITSEDGKITAVKPKRRATTGESNQSGDPEVCGIYAMTHALQQVQALPGDPVGAEVIAKDGEFKVTYEAGHKIAEDAIKKINDSFIAFVYPEGESDKKDSSQANRPLPPRAKPQENAEKGSSQTNPPLPPRADASKKNEAPKQETAKKGPPKQEAPKVTVTKITKDSKDLSEEECKALMYGTAKF